MTELHRSSRTSQLSDLKENSYNLGSEISSSRHHDIIKFENKMRPISSNKRRETVRMFKVAIETISFLNRLLNLEFAPLCDLSVIPNPF